MTLLGQARSVVARVTGHTNGVSEHVTSTEVIDPIFDPYLGWPDPNRVDDERPVQPVPPQHPSAPSGGGAGICYVPPNGAALSVLTKATADDFDTAWLPASAASLPPGGVATDVLTKQSATDGDATWQQPVQEVWVGPTDPAATNPGVDLWYDTSTTPAVLKARVGGAWVTVTAGGEVWIGPTDPIAANPSTELWYDTTARSLKARVGTAWVVTGDEVFTGTVDPYVTDPTSRVEIWNDTSGLSATPVTPVVTRIRIQNQWITGGEVYVGPSIVTRLANSPGTELWYDTTNPNLHVLKVRVGGVWEEVVAGSEVEVSGTDPYVTDPSSAAELWFNTTTSPGVTGVLNVRMGGQWRPVTTAGGVIPQMAYGMAPNPGRSGALSRADHTHGTPAAPPGALSEVVVSPTDPYLSAGAADELWFDTSALSGTPPTGGVLRARVGGAWQPVVIPGGILPALTYDLPPSPGTSATLSRADHQHGTPRSEVAINDTEPSTPKDLWVDTSTDPHTLMAYVGNAYVPVGAAGAVPPNEVQIGGPDPTVRYPEAELWYDQSTDPPTLKARVNDQWVDVTAAGTSEVEIAASDPYTTDPLSVAELWFNTAANVRALMIREGGAWKPATPAFGTVFPQLSFGMSSFPGASEAASRADHSHGTPALADGASEVEIANDDPIATNASAELWVDADEVYDPAAAPDEVYIGIDDPQAAGGTQELWFNTSVTPPVLLAWDGAQWVVAVTASSEMDISATDPYTVDPASVAELWFDTSGLTAVPPTIGILRARHNGAWVPATGAGLIWRGQWNASTVYAQGDAVSYDQPSGPILGGGTPVNAGVSSWECLTQTNIGANPPPLDTNRWRLIVEAGDMGAQGDPGLSGLNWIGTWDPAGTYALNDAVNYDVPLGLAPGVSSYRCTDPVTVPGMSPDTDTSHWELIAEAGQQGPEGEMGAATIIVGDFGQSRTPADLPPDGLIPASWDAPGNPLSDYQMVLGQSLFYAPLAGSADPLDGHMFQYVSVNADPSGWLDIGDIKGQPGDPGIVWQGVWLPTQAYATNDGVYFEGSSYRCVMDVNAGGAPPTMNRNNWTILAAGATYNGTTDMWVGPDEPPAALPTQPETELWYDTDAVPVIPTHALRAFWQPDVQYVPGDQVLWPETAANIYMAGRDTLGEEPNVTGINDGMDFSDRGASPTVPQGLSAVLAAPDYADGVDIRYHTGRYAWGTNWQGGYLLTATNAGNLPVFSVSTVVNADPLLSSLRFSVLTNLAVPVSMDVVLGDTDTVNRPFLRFTAEVATNTLRMYDSPNGVDWTELGTAVVSPDGLLTAGVTAIHIGHDNDEPTHNWGGPQSEVETFNFAGVPQTSWVAFTQPSNPDGPNYPDPPPATAPAAGIGVSPQTGEDYQIVGSVGTVWLTDRYPAWSAVTSFVQWLKDGEETTALSGEGITFFGGKRLFESGGMLYFRGPAGSPSTNLLHQGYIVIDAEAAGNANARFYHDAVNNNDTTEHLAYTARSGDSRVLFDIKSRKNIYSAVGSQHEGTQMLYQPNGGWAYNWAYKTTTTSPPGFDVQGTSSFATGLVRSSAAAKENVADLDRDVAGRLIDALRPITFERVFPTPAPNPEEPDATPRPHPVWRQVGFTAENIEEANTPLRDALVKGINLNSETGQPTDEPDNKGISVDGLLAVAIAEIKSLRARVAELEAK